MEELMTLLAKLRETFESFKSQVESQGHEMKERLDGLEARFNRPGSAAARQKAEEQQEEAQELILRDKDGRTHKALSAKESLCASLDYSDSGQPVTFEPGSCGRLIRAAILGDSRGLNDFERKFLGEGFGSTGGWFVPEAVSARIIDLARNKTRCIEAGAFTLPMETPEMTLVKVVSDPTASWTKEGGQITESEGSFAPIKLKAWDLGALIRVTQNLLEDAPNAGVMLENMLASSLALELDRVALVGGGVNEPKGLMEYSGVGEVSMGANGAALANRDPFSQAAQKVAEANGEARAVICAPRTYFSLDRLKEATTNAPLEPPESFRALRKLVTNQVPITQKKGTSTSASTAFVGDYANLVFGVLKRVTLELAKAGTGSSGNEAFSRIQILIRCHARVDVAVLREDHFCRIVGITG